MKFLLKLSPIMAGMAGLVFAVACGGDDDDDGGDGNNAGTGGGGNAVNCVGTYDGWTSDTLADQTTSGACQDDTMEVCTNDIPTIAAGCGMSCIAQDPDPDAFNACTLACIQDDIDDPDPSDECLTCYSESVLCAAANCLAQCLADGSAPACVECRIEKGCTPTFFQCSGLPVPMGAGGSGG